MQWRWCHNQLKTKARRGSLSPPPCISPLVFAVNDAPPACVLRILNRSLHPSPLSTPSLDGAKCALLPLGSRSPLHCLHRQPDKANSSCITEQTHFPATSQPGVYCYRNPVLSTTPPLLCTRVRRLLAGWVVALVFFNYFLLLLFILRRIFVLNE